MVVVAYFKVLSRFCLDVNLSFRKFR